MADKQSYPGSYNSGSFVESRTKKMVCVITFLILSTVVVDTATTDAQKLMNCQG